MKLAQGRNRVNHKDFLWINHGRRLTTESMCQRSTGWLLIQVSYDNSMEKCCRVDGWRKKRTRDLSVISLLFREITSVVDGADCYYQKHFNRTLFIFSSIYLHILTRLTHTRDNPVPCGSIWPNYRSYSYSTRGK